MDIFARALLAADEILRKSPFEELRRERYITFDSGVGQKFERAAWVGAGSGDSAGGLESGTKPTTFEATMRPMKRMMTRARS